MLKAHHTKYTLQFKQPSGTSRGVYTERDCWFIHVFDTDRPEMVGVGECAPLPGLSPELELGFIDKLTEVCSKIDHYQCPAPQGLEQYSSIRMGVEMAMLDFQNKGNHLFFNTAFTRGEKGIRINGLVWMGAPDFMRTQVQEKIDHGYSCIKLKIGAIDFDTELAIIRDIRKNFSPEQMQIRVDANGAFTPGNAMEKLEALARLGVHSIEQPIAAGETKALANICKDSPIAIALDEELISHRTILEKQQLIDFVKPQYLILKPSLHGGFTTCNDWITAARTANVGWWITSALESNIGLNAIAQWTSTYQNDLHQGLGTGQLFTNNFDSPLFIKDGSLGYDKDWIAEGSFKTNGKYVF
jgi:o-succinylbenzoate synthase